MINTLLFMHIIMTDDWLLLWVLEFEWWFFQILLLLLLCKLLLKSFLSCLLFFLPLCDFSLLLLAEFRNFLRNLLCFMFIGLLYLLFIGFLFLNVVFRLTQLWLVHIDWVINWEICEGAVFVLWLRLQFLISLFFHYLNISGVLMFRLWSLNLGVLLELLLLSWQMLFMFVVLFLQMFRDIHTCWLLRIHSSFFLSFYCLSLSLYAY